MYVIMCHVVKNIPSKKPRQKQSCNIPADKNHREIKHQGIYNNPQNWRKNQSIPKKPMDVQGDKINK